MRLVIVMEGDRVAEIASDDPQFVGQQVAVMDYDTDRAELEHIKQVTQSDATTSGAVGRLITVVPAGIDLPGLYRALAD